MDSFHKLCDLMFSKRLTLCKLHIGYRAQNCYSGCCASLTEAINLQPCKKNILIIFTNQRCLVKVWLGCAAVFVIPTVLGNDWSYRHSL